MHLAEDQALSDIYSGMHLTHQFQVPEITLKSGSGHVESIHLHNFDATNVSFTKKRNQHYLRDFDKLIMVVMAIKEWFLPKYLHRVQAQSALRNNKKGLVKAPHIYAYHPCKHATKAPHVQRIIIVL